MGLKLGLYIMGRTQAMPVPEQGAKDYVWAKEKDVTEHCRKLHNNNPYDCTPHEILLGFSLS
jgi:hypothetical protein